MGFILFSIPALLYSSLVLVPLLLFVFYQRYSHQYFRKSHSLLVIATSIGSFAIAVLVTTRSLISFGYSFEIPYSLEIPKNETEKKLFDSAVIDEATYRSLTPAYFQKPCAKTPELVCQLGIAYKIDLQEYRIPLINGIISAITSILIGLWAQNWIKIKFRDDD